MKGKQLVGLVLIVASLLVAAIGVGAYVVLGGGNFGASEPETKYWHECFVQVDERTFSLGNKGQIQEASCSNTGKRCSGLFSLFSAEGTAEVWDSTGKLAAEDYKTGALFGDDKLTIRACSAEDSFEIRLYNEEHNLVDSKQV